MNMTSGHTLLCATIGICSVLLYGCGGNKAKDEPLQTKLPALARTAPPPIQFKYPAISESERTVVEELLLQCATQTDTASSVSYGQRFEEESNAKKERLKSIGPSILPVLLQHLTEKDSLRDRCISILSEMPTEATPAFLSCLDSMDDDTRTGAVDALAAIGVPAVEKVLPYLQSTNERHRESAAKALIQMSVNGEYLPPAVFASLASTLDNDESEVVRGACVSGLSGEMLHDQDFRSAFLRVLEQGKDDQVRMTALRAVESMVGKSWGNRTVLYGFNKQIMKSKAASDAEYRKLLELQQKIYVDWMQAITDQEKGVKVGNRYKEMGLQVGVSTSPEDLLVDREMKGKLIRLGLPTKDQARLAKAIGNLYINGSPELQKVALQVLVSMSRERVSDARALGKALRVSKEDNERREIIYAIEYLASDGKDAIPDLQWVVQHVPDSKDAAMSALFRIGEAALPQYKIALNDKDLRDGALLFLQNLGDKALPLESDIVRLIDDPECGRKAKLALLTIGSKNEQVRRWAKHAIEKGGIDGAECAQALASGDPKTVVAQFSNIEMMLLEADPKVRATTASAIGKLGIEGVSQLRVLDQLARSDKDSKVVLVAQESARKIRALQQNKRDEETAYILKGQMSGAQMWGRVVNQGEWKVQEQKVCGYINKDGVLVIKTQGKHLRPFSEGLARVTDYKFDRKTHVEIYIDSTGKELLKLPKVSGEDFHEGLIVFHEPQIDGSTLCGYKDKSGETVIPAHFESAEDFSEGLAAVVIRGKAGADGFARYIFIDKTGHQAFRSTFREAGKFSDGLALVTTENSTNAFIDKYGNEVNFQLPGQVVSNFSEGLAVVKLAERYGYADKNGVLVIPAKYDLANPFREGLAVVAFDGGFGFIDKGGNTVVAPRYDWAHHFSDGLALVKKKGLLGYIDKSGNEVIKPQFFTANDFSNGLAPVGMGIMEILD